MSTEVIVALIVALSGIATTIINNISSTKRIEKKVDDISIHEKENYMSLLRLTIMSEEMPDSERIIAGRKYIEGGGNGDVKKYYQHLLKTHTASGN